MISQQWNFIGIPLFQCDTLQVRRCSYSCNYDTYLKQPYRCSSIHNKQPTDFEKKRKSQICCGLGNAGTHAGCSRFPPTGLTGLLFTRLKFLIVLLLVSTLQSLFLTVSYWVSHLLLIGLKPPLGCLDVIATISWILKLLGWIIMLLSVTALSWLTPRRISFQFWSEPAGSWTIYFKPRDCRQTLKILKS